MSLKLHSRREKTSHGGKRCDTVTHGMVVEVMVAGTGQCIPLDTSQIKMGSICAPLFTRSIKDTQVTVLQGGRKIIEL